MAGITSCANCGNVIDEKPSIGPEERKPCPSCGSIARSFHIKPETGELKLSVSDVVLTIERIPQETLLLQMVVIPGEETTEGQLIEAVTIPWFEIIAYIEKDPTAVYQIPYRTWEEIIAGAYKRAGFEEVILTPRSGDLGRDVIAVKRAIGTVRVIDQVKAYGPGRLVTADEVQSLFGVLQGDRASKGFVTTTSDFAPKILENPFIREFIPSRLGLINRDMLIKNLADLAKKKQG